MFSHISNETKKLSLLDSDLLCSQASSEIVQITTLEMCGCVFVVRQDGSNFIYSYSS